MLGRGVDGILGGTDLVWLGNTPPEEAIGVLDGCIDGCARTLPHGQRNR